ncbi:MAG: extracellular solute-binding protein [Pseudomonadota bacterium]
MFKKIRFFSLICATALVLTGAAMVEAQSQTINSPEETGKIGPVHGMAMHGEAQYAPGETLDYANPEAPKGGSFRTYAIGSFDNLNPYILKGSPAAGANLPYDTLLYNTEDEAFSEYGLIAKSFEMPEDRSSVTFNLRAEARFHDGTPITAKDVIWSLETLKEDGHPFYRAYYNNVAKVVAENDHRVRFEFDVSGNRELPLIVGQMPVMPSHYWQDKTFAQTTLTPPLGSGPYRISDVDPGRSVTYERVEDYWGRDLAINKGRHNFDEISYEYYRDDTVALQAFLAGEYDFRRENTAKTWQTGYTGDAVAEGKIIKMERPHKLPTGMQGFVFNTRRDIFADKAVRRAINHAFDFEWSNKQFAYGMYERTGSYFENSVLASSGLPKGRELEILNEFKDQLPEVLFTEEFTLPKTEGTGQDMRRHLRDGIGMLEQAGWTLNEQGLREKDGTVLRFQILLSNASFERWAGPFIKNLRRMGIEADMRVVDSAQYQNRMDSFDFDMTVSTFGQSLSPGNEQRDYWHSSNADQPGSRNLIGVKDPVVDELIEMVIQAPDREELIMRTRALDRVLLWGHYVVPHWHIDYFRLAFWNKFEHPDRAPAFGLGVTDIWWENPDKAAQLPLTPSEGQQ